ncbi:MAG: hypothetical protein BIFFINMI_03534 [Phycisphaerae bacterium]|nr:hypothetical protein [Phycisphaerae bacterium]
MSVQPLKFKPDWPRAVERLMAWWQGEVIDRCCVGVRCRRNGAQRLPDADARYWMDVDAQFNLIRRKAAATAWLGESFPCYWPNIGPETLAAYLGCRVEFGPNTSWTHPLAAAPDGGIPELKFDPSNEYYQWVRMATLAAMEQLAGEAIVGVTDIHNAGDTLAAIRDPQQLCIDMIERPDEVKRAVAFLREFRRERFAENIEWTKAQGGTTTWLSCFSTGVYACTQIDFIVLISPRMFREFLLEELDDAGCQAEHVCYHLDGPGEIKHLDALLAMKNLQAIQWVCGAGNEPQTRWIDLLKRIRAAGKSLHLSVDSPGEALGLIEALGPEGLLITLSMETESEARAFLRDVDKASARSGR